ncbi:uncharacterized protein FYW61_019032 [Anableps anableps]
MEVLSSSDGLKLMENVDVTCSRSSCNLLKEAPFSSCNINPEPYIAACTDTLCRYPDLDGLRCRFLEAYARACSLKSNATLEDWSSKAECSPPEGSCQDRTCSDQEFCGEKTAGGDTRCFCRAIFASKYREINSLGDPPVCNPNSASLTLVGCLLEDKGIDYSVLRLKDPTCTGQLDQQTHTVTFSFNSTSLCGGEVTNNNSQVIYKNTIVAQNLSSDGITRQDQVNISFSCIQTQLDIQTVAFRIKSSSVVQVISSGPWNYSLTMKAYADADRTQAVDPNAEVRLNQKIWVELDTDGLDENLRCDGARRRRFIRSKHEAAAFISMAWTTWKRHQARRFRSLWIKLQQVKGCKTDSDGKVWIQSVCEEKLQLLLEEEPPGGADGQKTQKIPLSSRTSADVQLLLMLQKPKLRFS